MVDSHSQRCSRDLLSSSSSSSQPLPPMNPPQSSELNQYFKLDSDIDPDDEMSNASIKIPGAFTISA